MKSSLQSKKKSQASLPRSIACGLFFSLLLGMVTLVIGAFFAYRTDDPTTLILPLAYAALIITTLLCGFLTVKSYGRYPMMSGAMAGGLLVVFCFTMSLILGRGDIPLWLSLSVYAAMIMLSAIGGVGAGIKKKRRRHAR